MSHQVFVDTHGSFAAFPDRPHNQRLATAGIASGEDSGNRRHVVIVGLDVAARIELDSELFDEAVLFALFVKKVYDENPNLTYKQAMQKASKMYKGKTGKGKSDINVPLHSRNVQTYTTFVVILDLFQCNVGGLS